MGGSGELLYLPEASIKFHRADIYAILIGLIAKNNIKRHHPNTILLHYLDRNTGTTVGDYSYFLSHKKQPPRLNSKIPPSINYLMITSKATRYNICRRLSQLDILGPLVYNDTRKIA
jgi:hypothetical protein